LRGISALLVSVWIMVLLGFILLPINSIYAQGGGGGDLIPPVGGVFEGVDTIALIGAAVKANLLWLIPVIVAAAGIGFVITRKF